ncbi:LOW QUALITY PROTEIN: protein FAM117B-like [Alosa alosa]|uniref:LOW QUALITY PROTEIN: protein FAM117B-like n=1 Tax=Alosa alosa TaxID=278164 RepID=UPI002015214C|nr:LOW QUALITY PROTEIN: protein FAM117B-like [Alosa alosa]
MNAHNYGSGNVGAFLGGLPAVSPCYSPSQQLSWISDVAPGFLPTATAQQQTPLSASPSGSSRGRPVAPLQNRSPDHEQQSPERISPSSPGGKGRGAALSMRRTSSLEALAGPYLSGHWPRDSTHSQSHTHTGPCMKDQATQTPSAWAEECQEKRNSLHKRSASWGSTDQLKEFGRHRAAEAAKEQTQPLSPASIAFNGSHTVINQTQTLIPKSALIAVPATRPSPRLRNSLEGLNQEIERITIRDATDRDHTHTLTDVPDGRRAPPPHYQHSVDTQTPCNYSNSSSRSQSVSPTFTSVASDDSPCLHDNLLSDGREKDVCSGSPSSPKPNNSYMFMREPPEGCERVKAFEETHLKPQHTLPQVLCPDRNKVNFVPKSGSAFCLLRQPLLLPAAQELSLKGPTLGTGSLSPPPATCPSSSPPPASSSSSSSSSVSTRASCVASLALVRHAEENDC